MKFEDNDYEVGYGKPPVASRFKKGQSGNPGGRPRRVVRKLDPGKILQLIDNEELIVEIDGKSVRMRKAEIYFRQLFNKAMKGSLLDARLIAKTAAKYFGPEEAEGPAETRFIVMPDSWFTVSDGKNKPGGESDADTKETP
jgi:Family of unknown function (DUF5681)